jgi:DNA repair protein RadC
MKHRVREIVAVYADTRIPPGPAITTPEDAAKIFAKELRGLAHEHVAMLALNQKHKPIAYRVVARGTIDMAMVSPAEVYEIVLLTGAAACIVAHNHPSGETAPSVDDRRLWVALKQAGEIMLRGRASTASLLETRERTRSRPNASSTSKHRQESSHVQALEPRFE